MFKKLDYRDLEQKYLITILRNKLNGREISCFSLNHLKLLSTALELMLSLLAHSDVSLANIHPIDYFKCISMCITMDNAEVFYSLKKVTDKVDAPKSVNAVAAALCPLIPELQGRHSQRQMALLLPRSASVSKCQVSDCHSKSIDENKDNEKNYQTDKTFLFTIRLYTGSKM